MEQKQPLINQKRITRLVIGVVIVVLLVGTFAWFMSKGSDPLYKATDTSDWLVAVKDTDGGSQAVMIHADGTVEPSPGYVVPEGNGFPPTDENPTWTSDGQRVYFSSDREDNTFHIYRWDPGSDHVKRRTIGSRSKSTPWFNRTGESWQEKGLTVIGGEVARFDPTVDGELELVLQLGTRSESQTVNESGELESISGFDQLGRSFRDAKQTPEGDWIVAVMRRETDEILILQRTTPVDGKIEKPLPVVTASRIETDVLSDGRVVYSIIGFTFPDPLRVPEEFIKDGKAVKPVENGFGIIDPNGDKGPASGGIRSTDEGALIDIAASYDGKNLAAVLGQARPDGSVEREALVIIPLTDQPGRMIRLVNGDISHPTWHPSGDRIAYVLRDASGSRSIHSINTNGTNEKQLSPKDGSYHSPQYSSQVSK